MSNFNENIYVVIMAGGIGTRFWPLSRENRPKQFLDILGTGQTLIQATYHRFLKILPPQNIFIVIGNSHLQILNEQLPEVTEKQIVIEPQRQNTAPCIAYMAHKIKALNPNAIFIVAPSDHLILSPEPFYDALLIATNFAATNKKLLTLGIQPTRPETGYGYIQFSDSPLQKLPKSVFLVKTFTEKPSVEIAQDFLLSGDFLWNAGIFVWNVKAIIEAFEIHAPHINNCFITLLSTYNSPNEANFIKTAYAHCVSEAVDTAIMEKANNVCVIPCNCGWSDLGAWYAAWEAHPKNAEGNATNSPNISLYNSHNNFVVSETPKKVIVAEGIENLCIVDTENVLLICPKSNEKAMRKLYNDVKEIKGDDYI